VVSSVVIVGVGGIGLAIARRLGTGHLVILADRSAGQLGRAVAELQAEGIDAVGHEVDVTDATAVADLAGLVSSRGPIAVLAHTAGVSPTQAATPDIYRVDLLGAAHVIDAFVSHASKGTSVTVIASMAGQLADLGAADERVLALTPTPLLLEQKLLSPSADPATAYMIAKRGVQLRVQAAAKGYGSRGARINSVSPGVVHTPMAMAELASPYGDMMRLMLDLAPEKRIGAPADIAAAVAFLSSRDASYITGTDLLVDGGVISTKWSA
jgi:NAD(P)-dependent dehydrogenase (short-subunit alcohol dehydrogenase family)